MHALTYTNLRMPVYTHQCSRDYTAIRPINIKRTIMPTRTHYLPTINNLTKAL